MDDTGDSLGNTGTLTATGITGLGMAGSITYGTLEALKIDLGGGGDTFTVASTHAGTTELNTNGGGDTVLLETISGITTVNTAAGTDTVSIRAISAATTVNTGDDADTVNVGSLAPAAGGNVNSIAAVLTVNGEGGSDTLNVDDTGDSLSNTGNLTATELTGLGMTGAGKITYGTLEALKIGLGSGGDTFTIASTHTGTTELSTNAGTDTVNVRTIAAATTVNTGGDADTVNVGSLAPSAGGDVNAIAAVLTVNGEGGSDTLNVDDTGDSLGNTGNLTATGITGLGMTGSITYGTFEALKIGLGSGGDTFTIAGTHTGSTLVNANGGNDTVNVFATSGATAVNAGDQDDTVNVGSGDLDLLQVLVTVTSGSGSDKVNVDDGANTNTKSVNYRVTPSQVTSSARPGMPARTFAGLAYDGSTERLSLTGTNAANTFHVIPSRDTALQINGNLPAPGTVQPRLGDKLLIDLTTVSDSWLTFTPGVPGAGAWAFGDALPVQFTSIEKFNDSQMAVFSDVGVASTYGVRVFDAASGLMKFEVPAEQLYGATSIVGVRGVMGDLTGDGFADLVVGPNKGVLNATVRIFDGIDGRLVRELFPYTDLGRHVGGINVTAGDIDGDGWNDVVVAPAAGVLAPVRVFSGDPTRFLAKVGQDLWPLGRKGTSELTVVVADQNVDGPANRGQIFVGSARSGVASVQSFTLGGNGGWVATPGGSFQPFGTAVVRASPRLSAGDVNGDGVQDLIVVRPNDSAGTVKIFNGRRMGVALGVQFATIPSRNPANDETTFAFDLNGDGRDETIAAFRSTIGISPEVVKFQLSGSGLSAPPIQSGRFSANVSSAKDLTGYWLVDGRVASISQIGQEISLTYPDGRTATGLLVGTRYINVPSEKIMGEITLGGITWSRGRAPWQRVAVTGTYVNNGVLFHVLQQGAKLRVWSDGGDYGTGTINAAGTIIPNASSGRLGGSIFDIRWSGNSLGTRFEATAKYLDAKGMKARMFETASGDIYFIESSGKAALGRWIAPGQVRVNDWSGVVGVITTGGITWTGSRQQWRKV